MSWLEKNRDNPAPHKAAAEVSRERDQARDENLPVVQRQAKKGELPLKPVRLQPVKSPGIYEGEFGSKDGDVIFHFWPSGYHEAERTNRAAPRFKPEFRPALEQVMKGEFGDNRVAISYDGDVGAYSVIAKGWAAQQMHFDLSVRACEKLHRALGGSEG